MELQLRVPVGQELMLTCAQDLAGCGELGPPHCPQLGIALRRASVGGSLSVRKANDRRFDTAVSGKGQRSAEGKTLVIRMGHNAQQTKAHAASSL